MTKTKRKNWGSTASNGATLLKAFRLATGLKRFLRACLHGGGGGGPRSSGVGFFCFHALGDTKQKKPTPLDRGPRLHVNRVLSFPLSNSSTSVSQAREGHWSAKNFCFTQLVFIYLF